MENTMSVQELQTQRKHALDAAESIVESCQVFKRDMDKNEKQKFDTHMKTVEDLDVKIQAAESQSKPKSVAELRAWANSVPRDPALQPINIRAVHEPLMPKKFSPEYFKAFHAKFGNNGAPLTAALYEGAGTGGYAVPITVDTYIAPLAPTASDIRAISTVIETTKNILLPTTAPTGLPTTVQTAELAAFAQSTPSLGQTELQAYKNALLAPVSLELAEDVVGLETWMRAVVEAALLEQEDTLFTSGSGSGAPQGLVGNVGAGITAEPDGGGNLVSFAGLSALMGAVKPKYLTNNAAWLLSQGTAIVVRAALAYSNASWAWTRDANGVDRLFGFRVAYSASLPSASRGNAPILFGNFKMGYVIADRGGPGVRLQVLDQMFGTNGTLYWLLSRRTDARIWVQEAIQQYNIAAS
jgi:HK97 family phage major capsid protein